MAWNTLFHAISLIRGAKSDETNCHQLRTIMIDGGSALPCSAPSASVTLFVKMEVLGRH